MQLKGAVTASMCGVDCEGKNRPVTFYDVQKGRGCGSLDRSLSESWRGCYYLLTLQIDSDVD